MKPVPQQRRWFFNARMPTRSSSPCRQPGCHALVPGGGYCQAHKAQSSGWNRYDRGSRHVRGYGAQWEKIRKQVLGRDHGLCRVCLAIGRVTPATAVDHIIPKSRGGGDDLGNLQAICDSCHRVKTQAEASSKS